MGILGAIFLLISIVNFAAIVNSAPLTALYVIFVIACVVLLIKVTLKRIPKAKTGFSIYLNKDQEGYRVPSYNKSLIGKEGKVIADLKPGGYVLVEGKKQAAISQTGYIPSGSDIVVIGGEEDNLIVKKSKQ